MECPEVIVIEETRSRTMYDLFFVPFGCRLGRYGSNRYAQLGWFGKTDGHGIALQGQPCRYTIKVIAELWLDQLPMLERLTGGREWSFTEEEDHPATVGVPFIRIDYTLRIGSAKRRRRFNDESNARYPDDRTQGEI